MIGKRKVTTLKRLLRQQEEIYDASKRAICDQCWNVSNSSMLTGIADEANLRRVWLIFDKGVPDHRSPKVGKTRGDVL